jgi:hypothetical protein
MGTSSGIVSQDIVNDGQDVLNEVSSISGGMSFFKIGVNASAATSVFEMIASELRNQYTVAIMTSNLGDDKKWHKLKAKVSPVAIDRDTKHLLVRTREGFYLHR